MNRIVPPEFQGKKIPVPTLRVKLTLAVLVGGPIVSSHAQTESANPRAPDVELDAVVEPAKDLKRQDSASERKQQKLRFSFRGQRWDDVIDWFADEADLTIALDAVPGGTFNFVDDREYTVSQALDVMNSVLLTKAYTMVRRDKMLFIVDLQDDLDKELVRDLLSETPPAVLDERGEYELTKCRFSLTSIPADEAVKQITPLLGPAGSAAVMPQANQLSIVETGGRLRSIHDILKQLDEQKTLYTFRLRSASPQRILENARQLLGIAEDANGTEDGTIRIAIDEQGGTVLAAGKPEKVALVRQIVQELDGESDGPRFTSSDMEFRTHSVRAADAASVLRVLQTVLAGRQAGVRVEIHPGTGDIIAFARPDQHQRIEDTIAEMEQNPLDFEVIPMRTVDPASAIVLIGNMFKGDGENAPSVDGMLEPPQIIVRGTQAQINQIKTLLARLGESFNRGREVQGNFRMLKMDPAAASDVIRQAREIWGRVRANEVRVIRPSAPGRRNSDRRPSATQSRPESNRRRVTPKTDDRVPPDFSGNQLRDGARSVSGPGSATPAVRRVHADLNDEPQDDEVELVPAVLGAVEKTRDVPFTTLVERREDQAETAVARHVVLTSITAADTRPSRSIGIDTSPSPSLREGRASARGGKSCVTRTDDVNNRSLLFQPSPLVLRDPPGGRVKSRVETNGSRREGEDRREGTQSQQKISVTLAQGPDPASELLAQLSESSADDPVARLGEGQVVDHPDNQSSRPDDIVVIPTPGGVMIRSDDEQALSEFESIVNMLNTRGGFAPRFHVFYLKHLDAESAKTMLSSMVTAASTVTSSSPSSDGAGGLLGMQGGGVAGAAPSITADSRLNALIVQASPQQLNYMEQLLKVLDQESGPEDVQTFPRPKFIPVNYTSAESVAAVLRDVYANRLATANTNNNNSSRGQSPFGRGGFFGASSSSSSSTTQPKLTIGVDSSSNSIVVSAPGPLLAEVESVVREIDERSNSLPGEDVAVLTVKKTNPQYLQAAIAAVLGDQVRTTGSTNSGNGNNSNGSRTGNSNSANQNGRPNANSATPQAIPTPTFGRFGTPFGGFGRGGFGRGGFGGRGGGDTGRGSGRGGRGGDTGGGGGRRGR